MRDVRYSSPELAKRIEALREEVQELDLEGVDLDRTFRFDTQPATKTAGRMLQEITLKPNLRFESRYTLPNDSAEAGPAEGGPDAVPVPAGPGTRSVGDPGLDGVEGERRPEKGSRR